MWSRNDVKLLAHLSTGLPFLFRRLPLAFSNETLRPNFSPMSAQSTETSQSSVIRRINTTNLHFYVSLSHRRYQFGNDVKLVLSYPIRPILPFTHSAFGLSHATHVVWLHRLTIIRCICRCVQLYSAPYTDKLTYFFSRAHTTLIDLYHLSKPMDNGNYCLSLTTWSSTFCDFVSS